MCTRTGWGPTGDEDAIQNCIGLLCSHISLPIHGLQRTVIPGFLSPVHCMVSEELCISSIKSDIRLVSPTCLYPFEYCIFGCSLSQFCIISKSKKHFTALSSESLMKREAREAPKTGCLFQMGSQAEAPGGFRVSNASCLTAGTQSAG